MDDFTLNVRQIGNYSAATSVGVNDLVLLQQNGLGGPYASITAANLVGTALANGSDVHLTNGHGLLWPAASLIYDGTTFDVSGPMTVAGTLTSGAMSITDGDCHISGNAYANNFTFATSNPDPLYSGAQVASEPWVTANTVASFNGRTGAVTLTAGDVTGAGAATLASPAFTGTPSAPTATPGTNTTQLATTAFVTAAVAAATVGVSSWNGRTGAVTLTTADVTAAGGAALASPAFTGTPTAPTATPGTSTLQLATTAFVAAAGSAALNSPTFTGTPSAPTAAYGTNTTQLATTAFVQSAVVRPARIIAFTTIGAQTYTPLANLVVAIVECVGGGGAGGGTIGAANVLAQGGGGGGGGYSRRFLTAAQIGSSQTVTIGSGGTPAAGAVGGNGGQTSFGSLCIANGGYGGNTNGGPGGAGGVTSGAVGDVGAVGNAGAAGFDNNTFPSVQVSSFGGSGGAGFYGGGAAAVAAGANSQVAGNTGYMGGGGSGASTYNASANQSGGPGGGGICVVTEFVS